MTLQLTLLEGVKARGAGPSVLATTQGLLKHDKQHRMYSNIYMRIYIYIYIHRDVYIDRHQICGSGI